MEEKIDEIKLSKDDSFIIRINYVTDGTTIGEYDSVQVSKQKNNIICEEHLSRTSAAVLKCAYDYSKGRHKGHYISHTPNAPLQWPLCTEVRPRNYKEIIDFLEDYACYFVYKKSKGVYWNPNPTLTHEPTVTPIETETIQEEELPKTGSQPVTEDDNRPVTPRKLWEAGCRTYKQSTAGGSRFHLLHIDEHIMPFYRKDDKRAHSKGIDLPIHVRIGESKDESSLKDALADLQGNYYLIGEGGIGKTTALFRIMEQHYKEGSYDPDDEIPLFVTLNHAPHVFERWYYGSEGMKSSFIRMEIGRQLLGCDELADVPDEMVKCITEECKSSPDNGKPKYLLLLDGLNEVSMDEITDHSGRLVNDRPLTGNVRQLIIGEIQYLLSDCPNVRIMLTSRTDEINVSFTRYRFEKLYLTGLKEDNIREYLANKKFTPEAIDAAITNERLLECLVIPLFLTMYADLRDISGISSRGEILSKFFHERGDNIVYTQQEAIEKLKFNASQLRFILDFLLPAIGWKMERDGEFEIQTKEIRKIIEPVLKGWKPTAGDAIPTEDGEPYDVSVIGEYGKSCFETYRSGRNTVETAAEEILASGKNMAKVTEYVMNCVMDVLKIMYCDKGKYSFIHHHFRDYFAAVHDINMLRMAVCAFEDEPESAFESLAPFIAHANRREKSIFIGEILGEQHNAPILKGREWKYNVPNEECSRNLIKRALDVFRGRFGEEAGYGVYNLIEVLKLVREDLSGANLTKLDFNHVNINGFNLGEHCAPALFDSAKLGHNTLFPVGHSNHVTSAVFSPDGTRIVTASGDNTAKVWDAATGALLHDLIGHNRAVNSAVFNQDGTRIVTASSDGTAKVWDAATGDLLHNLKGHQHGVNSAVFNQNSTHIVTASWDNTAKVWDAATGTLLHNLKGHQHGVNSAVFNQDGTHIVTASRDNTAKVWDAATGALLVDLIGHNGWVNSAVFNQDGTRIVTASSDHTAKVWDTSSGALLLDLIGHNGWVNSAVFNQDGTRIVTASYDNTAKVWDTSSGALLLNLIGHSRAVNSAVFNQDSTRIVTASDDCIAKVWCATTGALLYKFKGHQHGVDSAVFNQDGTRIVTASWDNTAKIWDAATGVLLLDITGHDRAVNSAVFDQEGTQHIVTASFDNTAKVWNAATGTLLHNLKGHQHGVNSAVFNQDGTHIVTASFDNTAKVWNATTGALLLDLIGHKYGVNSAVFNKDGTRIVTASDDNTAKVWNAATGALLLDLIGHSRAVNSAVFNQDSTRIATASWDGTTKVWDAATGALLLDLTGHKNWVESAVFNQDGTRIVTASQDTTAKVWDAATGALLLDITGHKGSVTSATFSPDGTRIVTASCDTTAKIWDAATGALLLDLIGHDNCVHSAVFSSDGTRIVTASSDGTTKIWDAATGECLDTISHIPGLMVRGVDLRHLHPDSDLSDEDKEILRRYGAIVD